MTGFADFHIHPDYSIDASGTIKQYCDRALEIGLKAICFTTHYDSNPKRAELDGYWIYRNVKLKYSDEIVAAYVNEILRAGERYSEFGLNVCGGLEIDYYPGIEDEVKRLKNKFHFDYIIGSVHCIDDIAISDENEAKPYFENRTVGQMADDYFRLLISAANCAEFNCLGHLDYYVRFGLKYYGNRMDKIEIDRFNQVFDVLSKNGMGIEINTSPFKRGFESFHPSRKILNRAIDAGVLISSVGSDSHRPDDLGKGIPEAYKFLKNKNIIPLFG